MSLALLARQPVRCPRMSVAAPEPLSSNAFRRILSDLHAERVAPVPFPPGPNDFNLERTFRFVRDPLPILLPPTSSYGPIFSARLPRTRRVHARPGGQPLRHVSNADKFHWRTGSMGDLIPLLGDGLLTIDGDYHRRARRIMLPAFHRERIAAAHDTMVEERRARSTPWRAATCSTSTTGRAGSRCASRCARCSASTRTSRATGAQAAIEFERALSFYGTDFAVRIMRGPRTPWRAHAGGAQGARPASSTREIARRRRQPDPERSDVLSMLIAATDEEDGSHLSDREVRDQVMTLLFAGHDTSTSTISFMLYELARHPAALAKLLDEQDRVLGDRRRPPPSCVGERCRELEMVLDETLRLYPAAWVGPRRAVETFEFGGHAGAGGRVRQLQLVGEPPAAGRVADAGGVRARALRAGGEGAAAQGRLRPVRRRLAHVHRHALRPAGDQDDRRRCCCSASGSSSCPGAR